MKSPTTIEEFQAQSQSATQVPGYRGDFVKFGIGFADLEKDSREIKSVGYFQVNTQESGAQGTYNHIWLKHGDELAEQGYALLSADDVNLLRYAFYPFRKDGQKHPNIKALDKLCDLHPRSAQYDCVPLIAVLFSDSATDQLPLSELSSAS